MPHKILIIDDDKELIEILKTLLTERNYEVFTARDGETGLEAAKKSPPDLILLDFIMPSMNGYEFLRAFKALKTIEGNAMIPVFVITAKGAAMEDLFKFEGVKEYFVKPIELSELIKKIEKHLGPND